MEACFLCRSSWKAFFFHVCFISSHRVAYFKYKWWYVLVAIKAKISFQEVSFLANMLFYVFGHIYLIFSFTFVNVKLPPPQKKRGKKNGHPNSINFFKVYIIIRMIHVDVLVMVKNEQYTYFYSKILFLFSSTFDKSVFLP